MIQAESQLNEDGFSIVINTHLYTPFRSVGKMANRSENGFSSILMIFHRAATQEGIPPLNNLGVHNLHSQAFPPRWLAHQHHLQMVR